MARKQKVTSAVHAIGRRKSAVARVYLTEGKGKVEVNGRDIKNYFGETTAYSLKAIKPLAVVDVKNAFDINVTVSGGGLTGQSDAIALGIARALCKHELALAPVSAEASEDDAGEEGVELHPWKKLLKSSRLLTRDARVVERKKYGFRKARKKEQYSKR